MTAHLTKPIYYYDSNGYKIGPVRKRDIVALAERGEITPETRITDNIIEVRAEQIPNLKFCVLKHHRTNKKKNTLVTPTEKKFKEYLHQHLPANIEIHCKVRLADVLLSEITNNLNIWKDKKYFMMHVDYTLVIKETQEIIMIIELDDKSHHSKKAIENDTKKNEMLKKSEVWRARVSVNKMFDPTIIEKIVKFCKKKIAIAKPTN